MVAGNFPYSHRSSDPGIITQITTDQSGSFTPPPCGRVAAQVKERDDATVLPPPRGIPRRGKSAEARPDEYDVVRPGTASDCLRSALRRPAAPLEMWSHAAHQRHARRPPRQGCRWRPQSRGPRRIHRFRLTHSPVAALPGDWGSWRPQRSRSGDQARAPARASSKPLSAARLSHKLRQSGRGALLGSG